MLSFKYSPEMIFLAMFAIAAFIQLLYYIIFFGRLAFYKPVIIPGKPQPVSVIICARNELDNLRKYIYPVLEQAYHEFEVIVVNDCSWDGTDEFLKDLSLKYTNLKVVTIQEQNKYTHGKKFAVMLGIKAAKNEILLFIDGDCMPNSRNWIANMQNQFDQKTEIVLGYGPYFKKKGLLNKLIRYESFYVAMQYLSFSLSGHTYMGVGRNMAYRKSLFFKNKGFASHYHILSGDDDLFINETATGLNTRIEINPDSFTYSEPETSWAKWFSQKRRHISTGRYYKNKHKFLLGVFSLSHVVFYASLIGIVSCFRFDWRFVIVIYSFRYLIQLIIFGKNMKKFKELGLLWLLPLWDFLISIIYPILALSNLVFKKIVWK